MKYCNKVLQADHCCSIPQIFSTIGILLSAVIYIHECESYYRVSLRIHNTYEASLFSITGSHYAPVHHNHNEITAHYTKQTQHVSSEISVLISDIPIDSCLSAPKWKMNLSLWCKLFIRTGNKTLLSTLPLNANEGNGKPVQITRALRYRRGSRAPLCCIWFCLSQ